MEPQALIRSHLGKLLKIHIPELIPEGPLVHPSHFMKVEGQTQKGPCLPLCVKLLIAPYGSQADLQLLLSEPIPPLKDFVSNIQKALLPASGTVLFYPSPTLPNCCPLPQPHNISSKQPSLTH